LKGPKGQLSNRSPTNAKGNEASVSSCSPNHECSYVAGFALAN
jgi:hypothetical protein